MPRNHAPFGPVFMLSASAGIVTAIAARGTATPAERRRPLGSGAPAPRIARAARDGLLASTLHCDWVNFESR
jgi:hypothetical protein